MLAGRLFDAELRASPRYELLVFDRLSADERAALGALIDDRELYGVLRPRSDPSMPTQSVTRDVALLFFTMERPGTLPRYIEQDLGPRAEEIVLRLVSDGILEVFDGHRFVYGPDAVSLVRPRREGALGSEVARLSRAALDHAASFESDDAGRIAERLYRFNTAPLTPKLARALSSDEAITPYLGLDRALKGRGWRAPSSNKGPWLAWTPRGAEPVRGAVVHKLYVSPTLDALPTAFPVVIDALSACRAVAHFKVGASLQGLLRPDKMVAYFASFDALGEAAASLREALRGTAAQGVPFTAPIDDDGLLSWGLDPRSDRPDAPSDTSFRMWVVERLAAALVLARHSPSDTLGPSDIALERLALEGFDTASWTPTPRIWSQRVARHD